MCLVTLVPQPEQQQLTSMMSEHGPEAVLCVVSKWRKQAVALCRLSSWRGVAWGTPVLSDLFFGSWQTQVAALFLGAALWHIL